ncbi:MAG: response regulator receiver protein [Gallionellales bacterium GWA2_55_18]|nr:MAG: response regulator receiver protein [Gallionellales bacterium GWA2_55_18]
MMIRAFVLAKYPQWIIIEAASGNEALEIVGRDTPNYCTMDINMPGLIGTEAAAQILAKYPGIRVAIFSSNIQEAHRTRAATLGARFVAKPVTEKTVAQALEFFESQA